MYLFSVGSFCSFHLEFWSTLSDKHSYGYNLLFSKYAGVTVVDDEIILCVKMIKSNRLLDEMEQFVYKENKFAARLSEKGYSVNCQEPNSYIWASTVETKYTSCTLRHQVRSLTLTRNYHKCTHWLSSCISSAREWHSETWKQTHPYITWDQTNLIHTIFKPNQLNWL